ncbi:MAG: peptidoglycan-binding protein [Clostridia bacterium]|nr:peptidoglycan-binding protein [Clostridia bacterium]
MKQGHSGSDVSSLQSVLKKLEYTEVGAIDGIFGSKTNAAVRKFQKDNNCNVDGVVGPQTRAAIERALSKKTNTVGLNTNTSTSSETQYNAGNSTTVSGELSKKEINKYLYKKYLSAPPVIKTRSERLQKIIENANNIMIQLYAIEELL